MQLSRPLDGELLHTQFNVQQVAVVPPVPECGVVVARVRSCALTALYYRTAFATLGASLS